MDKYRNRTVTVQYNNRTLHKQYSKSTVTEQNSTIKEQYLTFSDNDDSNIRVIFNFIFHGWRQAARHENYIYSLYFRFFIVVIWFKWFHCKNHKSSCVFIFHMYLFPFHSPGVMGWWRRQYSPPPSFSLCCCGGGGVSFLWRAERSLWYLWLLLRRHMRRPRRNQHNRPQLEFHSLCGKYLQIVILSESSWPPAAPRPPSKQLWGEEEEEEEMNNYLFMLFYLTDDRKDEYEDLGPEASLHTVGNGTGKINM